IVASQTIAEHLMPIFLASLAAELPGVPATFEVENTAGVISALRRARADLGFIEGGETPGDLDSCVIGHDHLVAVVAPIHPWAEDESIRSSGVDAEQLAATALIVREEGSGTREVLATALAPRPVAEPAMVLHSNAAVRTAVAGGAGCALLSELVVAAGSPFGLGPAGAPGGRAGTDRRPSVSSRPCVPCAGPPRAADAPSDVPPAGG